MNISSKTNVGHAVQLSRLRNSRTPVHDLFDTEVELFLPHPDMNTPSVNMNETMKEYVLEVAAPGLMKHDFIIEITNQTLYIKSNKKALDSITREGICKKRKSSDSFYRSFTFPKNVKAEKILAHYTQGILKVIIPKEHSESTLPKRIQIL